MQGAPTRGLQQRHGPSGHIPEREILPASSMDSSPRSRTSVRTGLAPPQRAKPTPEAPRDRIFSEHPQKPAYRTFAPVLL